MWARWMGRARAGHAMRTPPGSPKRRPRAFIAGLRGSKHRAVATPSLGPPPPIKSISKAKAVRWAPREALRQEIPEQSTIDDVLQRMVTMAISASIEPATQAAQLSAMRRWVTFCTAVKRTDPVRGKAAHPSGVQSAAERLRDEWLLMEFATATAMSCVPDTAAAYVSHVQSWHEINRACRLGPATGMVQLRRAIIGLIQEDGEAPGEAVEAPHSSTASGDVGGAAPPAGSG